MGKVEYVVKEKQGLQLKKPENQMVTVLNWMITNSIAFLPAALASETSQ